MDKSIKVKDKYSILNKVVFELRYDRGFTYLDRCGRTINEIMECFPEWLVNDNPNPSNAALVSLRNGCRVNFSATKCNFALEKSMGGRSIAEDEFRTFVSQTADLSQILTDQLGLNVFKRIGYREWHLFEFRNIESSAEWLQDPSFYTISPKLLKAFGGKLDSFSVAAVMEGPDRKFRISFNQVERSAQLDLGQQILNVRASSLSKNQDKILRDQERVKSKMRQNPEFAAMIDLDALIEDPVSVNPRDFIETSSVQFSERFSTIVP